MYIHYVDTCRGVDAPPSLLCGSRLVFQQVSLSCSIWLVAVVFDDVEPPRGRVRQVPIASLRTDRAAGPHPERMMWESRRGWDDGVGRRV